MEDFYTRVNEQYNFIDNSRIEFFTVIDKNEYVARFFAGIQFESLKYLDCSTDYQYFCVSVVAFI
jgi:hypothetical protein